MTGHVSERSEELEDLLRRLRPKILDLLRDHSVPDRQAAEIVHDTFVALAVRWDRLGNREAWILGTIEARCRSSSAERSVLEATRREAVDDLAGDDPPEGSEEEGTS